MYIYIQDVICECKTGFMGAKCELRKNCGYCTSEKCGENGKCASCEAGLEGEHCETFVCANMKKTMCLNRGKKYFFTLGDCTKESVVRKCDCDDGYTGKYCEKYTCDGKETSYCNDQGKFV